MSAGSRQTLIPDAQSSIVSRLDSASGALTTAGYGAYGENPSQTTAGPGYTAQRHDPETQPSAAEASGLYYYRARMYSPQLGRFLQPIRAEQAEAARTCMPTLEMIPSI
ncbi:MAG: hypothetical protein WDM81_14145 [Rhizomicrobium sp.]